jgi:hypothetical protein
MSSCEQRYVSLKLLYSSQEWISLFISIMGIVHYFLFIISIIEINLNFYSNIVKVTSS